MEPILTKDGVSVSRSLQLEDSTSNAILEVARSASERTVQEAGDGTTTATVLADTIVQKMHEFLKANPKFSPQKVVRTIEKIFKRDIEEYIKSLSIPVTPEVQRAVILCSSNGDEELTDTVAKAFELTGKSRNEVEEQFGGLYRAFQYGAPPHGGAAFGIDRIVMLLCGEENLREVVLFPMNQRAEDLMMGAPSEVTPKQLKELSIRLDLPKK